jgi:hypothetical protein
VIYNDKGLPAATPKRKPGHYAHQRPQAQQPRMTPGPSLGFPHDMANPGPGVIIYGDVLPAQVETVSHWQAEHILMARILEDAMKEYVRYFRKTGRRDRRLWLEVDQWFREDDYHWPFSFVNICLALDLPPKMVRKAVVARVEAPILKDVFSPGPTKWCGYGKHWLPATREFFSFSVRGTRAYWQVYCRPCSSAYSSERHRRRRRVAREAA